MLICKQKLTWSLDFFTDFLHFKESYNLIGQQHFGQQLQKKNFARHGVCDGKNKKNFQFALFLGKTNDKFSKKMQNTLFSTKILLSMYLSLKN